MAKWLRHTHCMVRIGQKIVHEAAGSNLNGRCFVDEL